MKPIRTAVDLEQALTCLQVLPEEDFENEFAALNHQLVGKLIRDRREIISNCSDREFVPDAKTLAQLAKKTLSRKIRKKLIQRLKEDPSPTAYRTRKEMLDHLYGLIGGKIPSAF